MKWEKRKQKSEIQRYLEAYEGPMTLTERGREQARLRHEAFLYGVGGATGGTVHLLDGVFWSDNQQAVLETLSARFPKEFTNMDAERWGEKLVAMEQHPEVLSGYVNGISGYQAELFAKQFLEDSGYEVAMAPTVNYPNSDLFIKTEEGILPVQVKTLADPAQLNQAITDNQGIVEHYVINDELYQQLEASGRLETYENQGLTIWNGGYENEMLRADAVEALAAPNTLVNQADHFESGALETVPIISLALGLYRSSQALGQFRRADLNGYEVTGQIGGELSGIGIRGLTAGTAGFVGMTLLGPVGLIGGVYLGGRTGAKWTGNWKRRLSFGEIMFLQERSGQEIGSDWFLDWVMDVLFEKRHIQEQASLLEHQTVNGEMGKHLQQYILAEYERYAQRADSMRERFQALLTETLALQESQSPVRLAGELMLQLYPLTRAYAPECWSDYHRRHVSLRVKTPHYPDQLFIPAFVFVEQLADVVLGEEGFA